MSEKKAPKQSKKAEDIAINPLAGKVFIGIERLRKGWVVRKLTVTDDDIELEALCDTDSSFLVAKARFMAEFNKLMKKEVRKNERD